MKNEFGRIKDLVTQVKNDMNAIGIEQPSSGKGKAEDTENDRVKLEASLENTLR